MFCSNVCECWTVGHDVCECGTVAHDVCETMGAGVTVYADFVDGLIDSLSVESVVVFEQGASGLIMFGMRHSMTLDGM